MDLALSDEQEQLVGSFAALLAKAATPQQVRDAEPIGFDAALWRTLGDTGAIVMGVPEDQGGWGASLLDMALVAEQLGRTAAPAPVIEAQVAARLLGALDTPPAHGALERALAGGGPVTLAVRPAVGGRVELVPGGAVADAVVVLDGSRLLLTAPGSDHRQVVSNLGSAPLADLQLGTDDIDLASGPDAVHRFESALDEWLVLTAAAVVGLGATALELACTYATERRAFGSAIGAFQGVAHPLADDATNLDGARLLVQKAAWTADQRGPRTRELAAMAFAFAVATAEKATYDAIHVHGGYGFMLEYDVQLHYRRVRAWTRVWGDADTASRRAAAARYGSGVVA